MRNIRLKISILLLCICVLLANTNISISYAISNVTIDDDIYSLYVDEYPDDITNGIYAKFKSAKSNVDDYYLNLTSIDDNADFEKALKSGGVSLSDKNIATAFTTTLYLMGEDDDIKKTDSVEVLIPIPDDAQEHYQDCEFYIVSSGKAKVASYTMVVDSDEVFYVQVSLPTYTTYGFLYNDPDSYEEDEDDEDENEDDENEDNEETENEDDYIDEDYDGDNEDEDNNEESTPTASPSPTAKPSSTLSPSPTLEPTSTPKPTSKPKATNTPTPKVVSSNNNNNSSNNSNTKKDSIPKTGDDFPLEALALIGGISGVTLLASLIIIKKRR